MSSVDFETKGSFADVVLPALLVRAMNSRFTGMFRAERESIIKVIYFKEGDIAFASSNQPSDRLGEVLIKRGQLTREQLDMAMSKLEANVSLGRMLVELGYLSPKELLAGAKAQVEEILYSLNTWREGTFEFVEGPLAPRIVDLKLNMRQVIYQSIMQLEDRTWILQQLGSMEAVFGPTDELNDALATMKLEPEILEVVANIDGTQTVRDLCARSTLDEFTVTKATAAVYLLNLVQVTAGGAGDQFLSPFGQDTEQGLHDSSATFSGSAASDTIPGFAPFSSEREDEPTLIRRPVALDDDVATTPSLQTIEDDGAETEPGPMGDEELSYEEEDEDGWDDDAEASEGRAGLRRFLVPAVLAATLGAVGIGGWLFRDKLPFIGGGEEQISEATPPATPRTTAATPVLPTPVATVAPTTTMSPALSATPAEVAATPARGATPSVSMSPASSATPVAVRATPALAATPPSRTTPATAVPPRATPAGAVPTATVRSVIPPPPGATPVARASVPAATPAARATPVPTAIARATPAPRSTPAARATPVVRSTPAVVTAQARPTPISGNAGRNPTPPKQTSPTTGPGTGTSSSSGGAGAVTSGAAAKAARSGLEAGNWGAAANSFETALGGFRGYSLQLEIICQQSSIQDGWTRAAGSSEYMVVPFRFKGKPCYRVLWGVFDSSAAAQRASASVPAFFKSQLGGRPVPVVRLGGR